MSAMIANDVAQPRWRQLCEAAVVELDPERLLERIVEARTAVLEAIERRCLDSPQAEGLALHDALDMLLILHDIAKRDLGEQQRTGT
jgi:hypothetical protein